jgi:hypothetical protein
VAHVADYGIDLVTAAGVRWLEVTWGERETTGPVALILRFAPAASIVIACGS